MSDWIFTLKGLNPSSILTIKTNNGTYAGVTGGEGINDTTKDLFAATAADKLPEFLGRHPELMINDGTTGDKS